MNSKRRNRKRAKKPKFLSLCRIQLAADESQRRLSEMHSAANNSDQLNLIEDRDNHEDVAFFFSAADGGATSLSGLLEDSTAADCSHSSHATNNLSSRAEDLSPSYGYGGQESESGAALVKSALRNRERDSSEDKWVCYSEVVERKVKKIKEEEVTSSAVDLRPPVGIQRLSLKLDYQEIMKAWSDKGPLYIDGGENSSQIVPDVNDDFFANEIWGCNAGLWAVPKMESDIHHSQDDMRVKNELELRIGQREASVLRYKEKRRNRLFSKKIRYEVRKLNAQKRPRLKGRFVKRT